MLAPARSCWQAKGEACGSVVSGVPVAWIPAVTTPLVLPRSAKPPATLLVPFQTTGVGGAIYAARRGCR